MMQAIVLTLEGKYAERIQKWTNYLVAAFDLTMIPTEVHCSLHIAEKYEIAEVERYLRRELGNRPKFPLTVTGLNLFFQQDSAYLTATVVHSPQLHRLHQQLYQDLATHCHNYHAYYTPENWVPHLTFGQVSQANLPAAVAWLAQQEWGWQVQCEGVTIFSEVADSAETHQQLFRMEFNQA